MPRKLNGYFATAPVAKLEGVGVCPWCRSVAFRPPGVDDGPFIDPVDFKALVCSCGWDSRRGVVTADDFHRAIQRMREAHREVADAADLGISDEDVLDILAYQLQREVKLAAALEWTTRHFDQARGYL